jgi:hypothetical protein
MPMNRRLFLLSMGSGLVAGTAWAQGRGRGPAWQQEAEQTFRMGRGLAPQLMTEEEWREHQQKMRTMTGEERERYRNEVHQRMMERAQERGMALPGPPRSGGPESAPPPGPGMGGGMGPRGGRGR